jgi:hypothetical protein
VEKQSSLKNECPDKTDEKKRFVSRKRGKNAYGNFGTMY